MTDDGNGIGFELWEPTQQPDTEFYDGVRLTVVTAPLSGTLQNIAYQEQQKDQEHAEIIRPVAPTKINGMSGYIYQASGTVNYTVIFLAKGQEKYVKIINVNNVTKDPDTNGLTTIANQMIASITLL